MRALFAALGPFLDIDLEALHHFVVVSILLAFQGYPARNVNMSSSTRNSCAGI